MNCIKCGAVLKENEEGLCSICFPIAEQALDRLQQALDTLNEHKGESYISSRQRLLEEITALRARVQEIESDLGPRVFLAQVIEMMVNSVSWCVRTRKGVKSYIVNDNLDSYELMKLAVAFETVKDEIDMASELIMAAASFMPSLTPHQWPIRRLVSRLVELCKSAARGDDKSYEALLIIRYQRKRVVKRVFELTK